MLFLGCDGGSTKTELVLADEGGALRAHRIFEGCNYAFLGEDGFRALFQRAVGETLTDAGATPAELTGAVFGLPVYGEVEETERVIPAVLAALLPGVPLRVENDALMGWSGALSARPGVQVVSGTGAIAFGMDQTGRAARAGGWSLLFSDEGSCSWVGRQVITAFTKQADGRIPKTPLYELVRDAFTLTKDQYFSENLQIEFRQDSSKLAALQRLALTAAGQGDRTMRAVYVQAAEELTALACAVRAQLCFPAGEKPLVSYSGGLFRAGEIVLAPFRAAMAREGFALTAPAYPPNVGAAALAAAPHLSRASLEAFMANLDRALA